MMKSEFKNVFKVAKDHDYDRYLCTLYAGSKYRATIMTLLAFNYELGKIRETISEQMIGDIKLAWWREAIEGLYEGQVRSHYILKSMKKVIEKSNLPKKILLEMVEAREVDFIETPMDNISDLKSYALKTGGNLAKISAIAGDAKEKEQQSAYLTGGVWALVGILRAVQFQAMQNHTLLPLDELTKNNLSIVELASGDQEKDLLTIFNNIILVAQSLLNEAREICPKPSKNILPIFLPAIIAENYMKKLKKGLYDPNNFGAKEKFKIHLKLICASLRGRF